MDRKIIPYRRSINRIEREYPDDFNKEKYLLMQGDILIRLSKGAYLDELNRVGEVGSLTDLIKKHNRKMRKSTSA